MRSARPAPPPPTRLARKADVVIGIGTRWSDFTTASRTAFQAGGASSSTSTSPASTRASTPGSPWSPTPARPSPPWPQLSTGTRVDDAYRAEQAELWAAWDAQVEAAYHPPASVTDELADGLLTQGTVLGCVNELSDPRDVVLCAAGSMPGDLHKLWRVRDRKAYHVEYGYSCMGYEVPASLGIRLADETRDVFAMVGDGGYLMMPTELVTAVQERIKVIVVLVQNHGFHSIGSLSEELGSQRFGTRYRYRDPESGRLDGDVLPVDLAANARSLGVHVIEVTSRGELEKAIRQAKEAPADGGPILIHVQTDPLVHAPDSESWWDVPVSQVSDLDSTQDAYERYLDHQARQQAFLNPDHRRTRRRIMSKPALIGSAPDSWGVWYADDPAQTPWERFLDEVSAAGYTRIELGPYGYLPTDPARLSDELDKRGLTMTAGTIFEHLHRPDSWDTTWRDVSAAARAHRGDGGPAPRRDPGVLARPEHRCRARGLRAVRGGVAALRRPDEPAGPGDPRRVRSADPVPPAR